ncbi:MAG: T9SS type A sorting domain-containing protein [Bacteroidales bacterium]|nr:T9SS type A sorting domain-containing protein [Bacteroidales bacterium]
MNKAIYFLFVILPFTANSQNSLNLVPNWSFEFGQIIDNVEMIPQGEYQRLTLADPTIEDHIANWRIAYHNNCSDGANTPDWSSITYNKAISPFTLNLNPYLYTTTESCCSFDMHNDFGITPSLRFMFLDSYFHYYKTSESGAESLCKKRNKAYESIRVSLNEKLAPNEIYLLKIKYKAMQKEYFCEDDIIYTGVNTLRIHFSKWGPHWYSTNSNNQLWENAAVIWKNANIPGDVDCNWHQVVFEITVPTNLDQLGEMIIYCAEGAFFIDDVELYKKCPEIILVQNQNFNIFHQPDAFVAAETIIAGNNVNQSQQAGDVTISANGSVEFVAGDEVRLKHGFSTTGGYFHAYNADCETTSNNSKHQDIYTEQSNASDNVSIFPNPNNGSFRVELSEQINSSVKMIIQNQLGMVVFQKAFLSDETIFLNDLKPGIYVVFLIFDDDIITKKVVVQ